MKLIIAAAAIAAIPLAASSQTSPSVLQDQRLDQRPLPQPRFEEQRAAQPTPLPPGAPDVALAFVRIDAARTPPADAQAAWRSFTGRPLDAATIRAVADAVAGAYARQGTALYTVAVPAQDFSGGVLRLQVLEGHVEEVIVHGDLQERGADLAQAYAARLAAETPLTQRTLERYISLIRDIPGAKADIRLLQGATPGGVKLPIGLEQKRMELGFGVSNRGSPFIDREQVQADLALNGLIRQGDQTRFTLAASGDFDALRYAALSHSQPVGTDGARAEVSFGRLQTRPPGLPLKGTATSAGASLSYPVVRGYRENLYVSAGLDGVNSDNAVFGQTVASERTRVARLAASYSRGRSKSAFSASATASGGMPGLGARLDPLLADEDFVKLNLRAAYDRKLSPAWTIRLRTAAQAAGARLATSEQFALGGDAFGRGFSNALLLGDEGVAGSAELGWTPAAAPERLKGSEVYVFADAGEAHAKARPLSPAASEQLSSAGLGVRLAVKPGYVLGLEGAKPLERPAGVPGDWRFGFSLRSAF